MPSLSSAGVPTALLGACIAYIVFQHRAHVAVVDELHQTRAQLEQYTSLEARPPDNFPWVNQHHNEQQSMLDNNDPRHEDSDESKQRLLADPLAHFPAGHSLDGWNAHLKRTTPAPLSAPDGRAGDACDMASAVVGPTQWASQEGHEAAVKQAAAALRECGFVYLDAFYGTELIETWRRAYDEFRTSSASEPFRYPCQGEKRFEYMLPFQPPFNNSGLVDDHRLRGVLQEIFQSRFKMELMTVINSPPNSGNQRWHQGWRYLFHPEERLPPYAMVVTVPLVDVTERMGPSEVCPGMKLRFYRGWTCSDRDSAAAATTAGTVLIFDYKTLHRGPSNLDPARSRPMLSMVFTKLFFLNNEAVVNRGVSLLQTLHQRRYWEQWFHHPTTRDEQFVV